MVSWSRPCRVRLAAILVVCAAWALPAQAQWQIRSCTTVGKNLFVRDVMADLYYWYQFIPPVNAALYRSPEEYLEAIRYQPLDATFSYITSRAANDAFFSDSQFIGFGLSTHSTLVADGAEVEMRVSQVFPDSPAAEAGLARGDRILRIGAWSVTQWWLAGQLGEAFGPSDIGYQTTILYQRADSEPVEASMVKRLVTIPTVSMTKVFEVDGRRVGYVFFRNFVEPSFEALNVAFTELKAAKVSELVLDLRYNGGGLVSVAQHLASLIGGVRTNGQVMAEYFHNDRNAFRNTVIRFEEKELALTLDRLIVITTGSSASASELVINALRPFMPVLTIGETTYGKPVGQYGISFCDKTLAPVAFTLRNANGEGDFFGGFAPTCPAPDDLERQLGDVAEGSFAEALHVIRTGACTTPPEVTVERRLLRERADRRPTGFRQLLGAW